MNFFPELFTLRFVPVLVRKGYLEYFYAFSDSILDSFSNKVDALARIFGIVKCEVVRLIEKFSLLYGVYEPMPLEDVPLEVLHSRHYLRQWSDLKGEAFVKLCDDASMILYQKL